VCSRTLLAAISPCPNDTYCFQLWAEGKIPSAVTLSLSFHDIETLNSLSLTAAPYDITKISTACLCRIEDEYAPLSSGAAFAINGGPVVVAKQPFTVEDLPRLKIAVPGIHTSAFVALSLLYGRPKNIVQMPSSHILRSIVDGRVDAGLVIHEARFIYPSYGLHQVADIGDAYYSRFSTPLPLGVIVARRSLGEGVIESLSKTLNRSIQAAKNQPALSSFVTDHASELSSDTIWQHIHHYVTKESEMMSDKELRWIRDFADAARELQG
jgi:1,4-dihydroxy-6-naphthoate synthase